MSEEKKQVVRVLDSKGLLAFQGEFADPREADKVAYDWYNRPDELGRRLYKVYRSSRTPEEEKS